MPSLRISQEKLDARTPSLFQQQHDMPLCSVNAELVRVASEVQDANQCCDSMRHILGEQDDHLKVIGLDCEWDTFKNSIGMVIGSDKLATIQITCRNLSLQSCHAVVFQAHGHKTPPCRLLALTHDPEINFCGVNVGGDLKKIGKDLDCIEAVNAVESTRIVNLGKHARCRDVVQNGTVGMDELARLCLIEKMKKNEMNRISSKWSQLQLKLSNDQISHAALDALKSLEAHFHLFRPPDLTIRLKVSKATAEKHVDVVPVHGSVACMATRAVCGRMKDNKHLIGKGQTVANHKCFLFMLDVLSLR